MKFNFNKAKNEEILQMRGIGFEEIITEIELGNLISVKAHHNFEKYPNQEIMYVKVCEVIYIVPYVIEDDGTFFLKTLYPSRKATKQYIRTVYGKDRSSEKSASHHTRTCKHSE